MAKPPKEEPTTAPQAERFYPLHLGASLSTNDSSSRFYSLRYEFKPASIDRSKHGSMKKEVDNKVLVEFSNNQPGKPKVSFQGNIEECKDADGVVFFDGKSFRLERLHRAVKSLRHVRLPGEPNSGTSTSVALAAGMNGDPKSSPTNANGIQPGTVHTSEKNVMQTTLIREQVEEIVVGKPESPVQKKQAKKNTGVKASKKSTSKALARDVDKKELNDEAPSKKAKIAYNEKANDIVVDEEEVEEHESDYVLEDIDASEEEDGEVNKSEMDPAAVLRAQAAPTSAGRKHSSSGSDSSGSSTGSGSDGSSSESGGTEEDDDSGSSGADI